MASAIYVAPLHKPPPAAVEHILQRLPEVFRVPVILHPSRLRVDVGYDDARHQYNSTSLLAELLKEVPSPDAKLVGVTDVDLFIPVLTFVFGEAQLNGRVAIASMYRLRNAFYGLPEDSVLLEERLEKEVVHELGHTFNLAHCDDYQCVMYASNGVGEVDVKGADFCSSCRKVIAAATEP